MLVLNIITCCIVYVGVWFTMTFLHELGHVLALFLTKCILHKEKIDAKVLVTFRKGFTLSPLYEDLIKSKQYKLIKLNAIAGYLCAAIVGVSIFVLIVVSVIVKRVSPSISLVTLTVNIIVWFANLIRSIGASSDWKHFSNPESFMYTENIDMDKHILTKDDTLWLIVSIFFAGVSYLVVLFG